MKHLQNRARPRTRQPRSHDGSRSASTAAPADRTATRRRPAHTLALGLAAVGVVACAVGTVTGSIDLGAGSALAAPGADAVAGTVTGGATPAPLLAAAAPAVRPAIQRPSTVAPRAATTPAAAAATPAAGATTTASARFLVPPTSVDAGTHCASGVQAADLNAFFAEERGGLFGADYQRAYKLADGRVLWVFQDAFLRVGGARKLVHNAGLIQSGRCFTLLTGPGNSEWLMSNLTDRHHRWYWPLGGETNAATGNFDLLMVEMAEHGPTYLSHTIPQRVVRVEIDPSTLAVVGHGDAPGTSADLFGWSATSDHEYTYLFSHCYRQFGFDDFFGAAGHDQSCVDDVKVGRVAKGRLDTQPVYWNGSAWSGDQSTAVPVIPSAGRMVNPAQIIFDGTQFVSITKEGDWWGSTIYLDHAPTAAGPWTTYATLPATPRCTECNTYFASFVPWRAANGSLIGSLSHNRWDGAISAAYRPTVFDVPAPPVPSEPRVPEAIAPSAPARFVALTPCRLLDTRLGGTRPGDGASIPIELDGACGVPATASAVALTVTAVDATAAGFVTVYPGGTARPESSVLNYGAGETRANGVTARTGATGRLGAYVSASTHLVVDVSGAWVPSSAATSGRLVALSPARIADTRLDRRALAAGQTLRVSLPPGVPVDATALAVNITTVDAPAAGFLTAYAAGSTRPWSSNLNVDQPGQVRAATMLLPISSAGFEVFSSAGGHVIVDVTGYMTGASASSSTDGLFVADAPARLLDTRVNAPGVHPAAGRDVRTGVTASAVALNVTAVAPSHPGHLTVFAAGTRIPATSSVNIGHEYAVANLAIVGQSSDGKVSVASLHGADVVVDRAGWFI